MKRYLFLLIMCAVVALCGCDKQPNASFYTDKSVYNSGETVYLTNTSSNADNYMWVLPNESPSPLNGLRYHIPADYSGNLEITLIAYSKNKKKQDTYSKTVQVNLSKGNVVFAVDRWYRTITVTMADMARYITKQFDFNSTPQCNENNNGCANFYDLPHGIYSYYATDNNVYWNGSVTVSPNDCLGIKLTYGKATKISDTIKND